MPAPDFPTHLVRTLNLLVLIVGKCNKKGLSVQQKATRFAEIADKIGAQRRSDPFDLGSYLLLGIGRNCRRLGFFGAAIPTSRG